MAAAMARQKINLAPANLAANQDVRWRAERGLDLMFARLAQLFHLIQTAPADDPDRRRLVLHLARFNPKNRQDGKGIIWTCPEAAFTDHTKPPAWNADNHDSCRSTCSVDRRCAREISGLDILLSNSSRDFAASSSPCAA